MYKVDRSLIPYIVSYAVGTGLLIGGLLSVPKKEQCEATNTYHVHLFTRNIGNSTIKKWLQRENDTTFYKKNDDFLATTSFDVEAFDKLEDYHLFEGIDNIDYVHHQIKTNRDYMEFYYEYEETYYEEDEDGNKVKKTREYSGYTTNPRHRGVTGKTVVYHTRYYAYSLIYKDGNLELEKSPSVDDVREVLTEYPYISENTKHQVSQTFYFSRFELPYLDLEEFDPFYTPTVENNPLETKEAPQMIKKK